MELNTLSDMWAADCVFDDINIDKASSDIPKLHSKYLKILGNERIKLNKMIQNRQLLKAMLNDYYKGDCCEDDLKLLNRDQLQRLILKNEIPHYVDTDRSMVKCNILIAEQEEMCSTLTEILKQINARNFHLRNIIEWRKLTQFGMG